MERDVNQIFDCNDLRTKVTKTTKVVLLYSVLLFWLSI